MPVNKVANANSARINELMFMLIKEIYRQAEESAHGNADILMLNIASVTLQIIGQLGTQTTQGMKKAVEEYRKLTEAGPQ